MSFPHQTDRIYERSKRSLRGTTGPIPRRRFPFAAWFGRRRSFFLPFSFLHFTAARGDDAVRTRFDDRNRLVLDHFPVELAVDRLLRSIDHVSKRQRPARIGAPLDHGVSLTPGPFEVAVPCVRPVRRVVSPTHSASDDGSSAVTFSTRGHYPAVGASEHRHHRPPCASSRPIPALYVAGRRSRVC